MKKLKSFLGFFWAALGMPIILVMLLGSNAWVNLIASSGLEVSPWFTGGKVAHTLNADGAHVEIHEPVFQALIGERRTGFVQVNWIPLDGQLEKVEMDIDYDADGQPDFGVLWLVQSAEPVLIPYSAAVQGVDSFYRFEDGSAALRVTLKNK